MPINDLSDLPKDLVERWVNPAGTWRIAVFPAHDLNDIRQLEQFVDSVKAVDPHATGVAVRYLEMGREAIRAFQQALFLAIIAIVLISLLVLRSVRESALILLPLALAAILTGSATVLFGHPFNFANIIAVPLLLGLGIDSAIHIIHRIRQYPDRQRDILKSSTARGVFFSSLTTAFSFVSLAFVSHAGTASLGWLLTVGIVLTLIATLVVLPAFAIRGSATE